MTLSSELAEWKRKKAEAESKLKSETLTLDEKKTYGSKSLVAEDNIFRIEAVLKAKPWTDELHAEEVRHYEAVQSIYARYPAK